MVLSAVLMFLSCTAKDDSGEDEGLPLPVQVLQETIAVTSRQYLGAVEGKVNVEIRPQVEGILDSIYVDEGQFVKAGQLLFKINPLPYVEQLKNAAANVAVEKARLVNARIELDRLQPLVENQVIADVQLQTAQSNYELAKASLARSEAMEATARINLEFTRIKAPVSGFIGRIPKRIGNLVAKNDNQPMTILSDIHEVFVYFSMSESDYLFYQRMQGDSSARRLNPNVKLVLADGSIYSHEGIVDAQSGQIDRSTGSITLRATFKNPDNLLRSGNTGKIIMEQIHPGVIVIPQTATNVIQDRTFVFVLRDDNTVERRIVKIEGNSARNYLVSRESLSDGDRVVLTGLDRLTEGTKVNPLLPDQNLVNDPPKQTLQ